MNYPDDFKDKIDRIINADCLEVMPQIPDKSIDLILCDLPYGVTARNEWDSIIPLDKLWDQYSRIIKDNGCVILTAQGKFSAQLMISSEGKVKYQYSMVWIKPNHTNQLNAKKQPLRKHEDVLVFYNNQPVYNPQGLTRKDSMTKQGKKSTNNYGKQERVEYYQEWTNYPTTLIYTKMQTEGMHPTEKPCDLFAYLVKTYTNEGALVLDNCSGSGVLAIVCARLKRHFICIEKDPIYYQASLNRLEKASCSLFD